MEGKMTSSYKVITGSEGNRYQFFCDLSGALACTTRPLKETDAEKELELAWKTEGKMEFNRCCRCGRWVVDAMYNADVLECVRCAPWEDDARFCKTCGRQVVQAGRICSYCGSTLVYEGGDINGSESEV